MSTTYIYMTYIYICQQQIDASHTFNLDWGYYRGKMA